PGVPRAVPRSPGRRAGGITSLEPQAAAAGGPLEGGAEAGVRRPAPDADPLPPQDGLRRAARPLVPRPAAGRVAERAARPRRAGTRPVPPRGRRPADRRTSRRQARPRLQALGTLDAGALVPAPLRPGVVGRAPPRGLFRGSPTHWLSEGRHPRSRRAH